MFTMPVWLTLVIGVFRKSLLLRVAAVGLAALGVYKGIQYSGVLKERASVSAKGAKTSAKVQKSVANVDVEKTLRSICRDCP